MLTICSQVLDSKQKQRHIRLKRATAIFKFSTVSWVSVVCGKLWNHILGIVKSAEYISKDFSIPSGELVPYDTSLVSHKDLKDEKGYLKYLNSPYKFGVYGKLSNLSFGIVKSADFMAEVFNNIFTKLAKFPFQKMYFYPQ